MKEDQHIILDEIMAAFARGWDAAIKAARQQLPITAERPREDSYQSGRFDGVMDYDRVLLSIKRPVEHKSDCAMHNAPAMAPGACDRGAMPG